jgi:hypothetical protein
MNLPGTIPPPARLGKIMIGITVAKDCCRFRSGHAHVIDGIRIKYAPYARWSCVHARPASAAGAPISLAYALLKFSRTSPSRGAATPAMQI